MTKTTIHVHVRQADEITTATGSTAAWINLGDDLTIFASAPTDAGKAAIWARIASAATGLSAAYDRRAADAPCPADWGSAMPSQRCKLPAGHDGAHEDAAGEWERDLLGDLAASLKLPGRHL